MDNAYTLTAETLCRQAGIPCPEPEYRFHPVRKWLIDLAWPKYKLALEVEGGAWTNGRHTRGAGFIGDMAKYNALTMGGWKLLRYTPDQLADGGWTRDVAYLIGMTED